jgi:hypothetical protein
LDYPPIKEFLLPIISARILEACKIGSIDLLRKNLYTKYIDVNKKDSVSKDCTLFLKTI